MQEFLKFWKYFSFRDEKYFLSNAFLFYILICCSFCIVFRFNSMQIHLTKDTLLWIKYYKTFHAWYLPYEKRARVYEICLI